MNLMKACMSVWPAVPDIYGGATLLTTSRADIEIMS
jgi:hypothetical protein